MRGATDVEHVQALVDEGLNASQVAQLTGIPRTTVRHWMAGELPRIEGPRCPRCGGDAHEPDLLPPRAYAYGLGMYLGDGCILKHPRGVWRLEVTLDSIYPDLIGECAQAIAAIVPDSRVAVVTEHGKGRFALVRSYSKAWPCLFPQHGPGPKHQRGIVLEPWQERIVDDQPELFVRGLIHSDGCRVLNRVNGKAYPRYHFTQVSDDIRRLFCRSLRQLDIDYTWNDARNVSIARRASVARLDGFVGPKH